MEFKSVDMMNQLVNQREKEGAKLNYTVGQMCNENRIKIDFDEIDILKEFFANNCSSNNIPMIFDKTLIEVKVEEIMLRIFVEFKEGGKFIFLDIFYNWKLMMKMVIENRFIDLNDGIPKVNGVIVLSINNNDYRKNSQMLNEISVVSTDVVFYSYIFLNANLEDKTLFKEDTVQMLQEESADSKSNGKKSNSQKYMPPKRKNIYVPKKRRKYHINNITKEQLGNLKNKSERKYHLSEWPVRGYTYKRKNGTVVTVPPRVSKRRKQNDGEVRTGNNYIINNN